MRKPNLSKFEQIVALAERGTRKSKRPASTRDPRWALRAIHKKAETLFADALPQLNRKELGRLQRQHDVELRRLSKSIKRQINEGAAKASRRLDALVAAERATLAALPDDPFGSGSNLLLKVDFIRCWPTPQNLRDSHQAPGVNWAEFAFGTGDRHGVIDEKVSFYNVWQNPRDQAVLVDVLVRLTANGWAEASAGGLGTSVLWGWASEYGRSRVDVSADLRLWSLWQDPAPITLLDSVPLGSCSASGGIFGDTDVVTIGTSGGIQSNAVAPALQTTGFAVPAGASILIEASLNCHCECSILGSASAFFADKDYFHQKVGWAYAVVTLPPVMMATG
jgi:hypothetical protein